MRIYKVIFTSLILSTLAHAEITGEGRIGIGGVYSQKDIPTQTSNTDVKDYGGYLAITGDTIFLKRLKTGANIDLGIGPNTRSNPFSFIDYSIKLGFNIASLDNPFWINIGLIGGHYSNGTRKNNGIDTGYRASSIGIEGRIKANEKLRYEYSADYDYILSKEYAASSNNSTTTHYDTAKGGDYGIRASLGFSVQLKEDLFYYVKLRAKYQNITYNPAFPTTQNLVGMVEIGIGGR